MVNGGGGAQVRVFAAAVVIQLIVGRPPGEAETWLGWAARQPQRLRESGSQEARAAAVAGPILLGQVARWSSGLGVVVEAAILAGSFELREADRRAARVQQLLESGQLGSAAAALEAGMGAGTLDEHRVASAAIAELARQPESYLAVWFSYALMGAPAAASLALRPVLQSAFGWSTPWLRRWTATQPDSVLGTLTDSAAAAATAAVAPLLRGSTEEVLRGMQKSEGGAELAALAAALDRSLTVDGVVVNPGAPAATAADIRRARRLAWLVTGLLAVSSVALIAASPMLRRLAPWVRNG